ncbi:MAG TPA: phosphoribosylformylglycinamidine cyclo-ligase [Candidatus Saccharimonadales bacterium]|nr:phosphoribosylformylglycinamidine cyclo-ligase [Candidatus Saccharimonadales bacterium]
MSTYKEAGVDISRATDALARIKDRVRATKRPEVIGDIGAFGGLFRFNGLRDAVLVATTDGVGTKLELARLLDRHEGVGADLLNHCVNDALAMGAEPLFFLDYFSTSRLDPAVFARVVGAMADACKAQGVALLGGETAEMPGMYADGAYDLAGFLVGAVERSLVLDPAAVVAGDVLIGLPSTGLHTNGYTLARAICDRTAVAEGRDVVELLNAPRPELLGGSLADALLAVHRCYLEDIRVLRAAANVRSIAHLTGGGWEGNLPRALPEGLGAVVDRGGWIVPPLFRWLAEAGAVGEAECYDTWNMGIGLVAIVAAADERAALRALPDAIRIGVAEPAAAGAPRVRWA